MESSRSYSNNAFPFLTKVMDISLRCELFSVDPGD